MHLSQDLMFARIEEAVPSDDFGIFDQQPPELDEVTVAGALIGERVLHELIELCITLTCALQINAALFGGALMKFAKAGHARGSDRLRMARADCVQ